MERLNYKQILEETSNSVSNGHSIQELEKFKIRLKELCKGDKKSFKFAVRIINTVIKLKKKKGNNLFNRMNISILLTFLFLVTSGISFIEAGVFGDNYGEFGYQQLWNISSGDLVVEDVLIKGNLNITNYTFIGGNLSIAGGLDFGGNVYINASGEGALTIERDGGGEIMSFVRSGTEIGQILLNSNDFNFDARTNAIVFMIGTNEKMRIHDDGNVNITQNLSVNSLNVRSPDSICLAGACFENNATHTGVDTDWYVKNPTEPTASLGVYATNESIFTHATLILSARGSIFECVKNSLFHPYSPGASGCINTGGNYGSFVEEGNQFSWWDFSNYSKDEYGNIVWLELEKNMMNLNETGLIVNGTITADYFYGDGSQLTGISGGSGLWTNSSGDATYTSGYVGIGTSSPTEKLHLANGTFLQTSGNPTLAGVLFDSTNMYTPISVYVSGKYAYVTGSNSNSLAIIDISNPSSPTLVGSLIDSTNMNNPYSVYVSGKYAYIAASSSDSLVIVDVSNPSSPTLTGFLNDSTNMNTARAVYVSGKYAYVASYSSDSLAIVDISNASSPTLTGSLNDSTNLDGSRAVYVSGKYAYVVGSDSDSLVIVDVSNPSSPALTGVVSDSINMDSPQEVYVSGKYAYVAGSDSNSLAIIDISNASSPTLIGNLTHPTNLKGANSVYVSGKYAYVTGAYSDSLAIIDISNPSSPTLTGVVSDSINMDSPQEVYVSGKYAYVAGRVLSSLAIIDIGGIDSPSATIGDLAVSTLDVSENLDVANDLSVRNGIVVGGGIFSNGAVSFENSALITDGKGNVGIGTTTPISKLHVDGKITSTNINTTEIWNGIGDLKIMPDVQGDVVLFGDTQVADNENSPYVYLHRKASEGNDWIRFFISDSRTAYIHGSPAGGLWMQGQADMGVNSVTGDVILKVGDQVGANEVKIKDSSNNEVSTIDSDGNAWFNGNVGIGITNPITPLSIMGNGGIGAVGITQNQAGGLYTMELTTQDSSGIQATRLLLRGNVNDSDIEFYRGGRGEETATMFIEGSNGYVGINTTTPNQQLHILTSGSSSYSSSNDRGILITDLYGPRLVFEDSGEGVDDKVMLIKYENENLIFGSINDVGNSFDKENILVINRDGMVGIGTGTGTLQLPLEVRSADDNQAIFVDSRSQAQGVGGGIAFGGKYNDAGGEAMTGRIGTEKTNGISGDVSWDMVFQTQDFEGSITERMILTGDGKVGIGDITPAYPLDVNGAARFRDELYVDADTELSGTLTVMSNYVLEGEDVGNRNVLRKIQLAVRDGATPGTNIDVTKTTTQGRAYNSPTFTNANDLVKSGASGSYTLSSNGQNLILNFTDVTPTHVLSVNVLSDDLNNGGGGGYYVHTLVYDGIIQLMLEKSGSSTNLDWTAHTNTGSDEIIFDVQFITSD